MPKRTQRIRSSARSSNSARSALDGGLKAYSAAGKAAVAMGTVLGGATMVQAQITPITAGFFDDTPNMSITSVHWPSTSGGQSHTFNGLGVPWKQAIWQSNFEQRGTSAGPHNFYAGGRASIRAQGSPPNGGFLAGGTHSGQYVLNNLALGQQVKGQAFAESNVGMNLFRTSGAHRGYLTSAHQAYGRKVGGNFALNVNGYFGFEIKNNSNHNQYYGWMRVKVDGDADGRPTGIEFVAVNGDIGAINYTSDGSITVGEGVSAIPEPASYATGLALLALGAAGVREHHRRRQMATA